MIHEKRIPVGLLAEHLFAAGRPVYLGTVIAADWPRLRLSLEMADAEYAAVGLALDTPDGAYLVLGSMPFRSAPSPALGAHFGTGADAREACGREASGLLMGAAHLDGARRVRLSPGWERIATGADVGATRDTIPAE